MGIRRETVCDGDRGEQLPTEAPGQAGVSEDVPLFQKTHQPPQGVCHGIFLHQLRLCWNVILLYRTPPKKAPDTNRIKRRTWMRGGIQPASVCRGATAQGTCVIAAMQQLLPGFCLRKTPRFGSDSPPTGVPNAQGIGGVPPRRGEQPRHMATCGGPTPGPGPAKPGFRREAAEMRPNFQKTS
jgi:hypothetical protein